jgi:kinesin family protein C2/C3
MLVGALNGFRTCITCYGQTGSGKTHTLFGPPEVIDDANYDHFERGLACRLLEELFEVAGKRPAEQSRPASLATRLNVAVAITCVEIYNEQMTDLVTGRRVILRGGANVFLEGAAETPVASYADACQLLVAAQERKHVAETAMNARSSRAHTVLIVHLEQPGPNGQLLRSSVHILDLAGSEQLKLSKAEGTRKREAVGINSSLSVLGKVISALVEGAHHVPYFESTLTSLLRGALGGDSLTTMVVTCSSDPYHGEQTLSTLGFAQRCQQVVNQARPTAVSLDDALAQIDSALAHCEQVLKRQEERGLTHLPAFSKVKEQHTALTARRSRLLAIK